MRTRINETQTTINENKTLSYRVNSTPLGCKAETQVSRPLIPEQVQIIFLKSTHIFSGNLGALRRGFTKASSSTKKLPQLTQVKQGEELKPSLFLGLRKSSFNYWKGLYSTQTSIYELSLGARPPLSIYKHS